MNQEPNESPVVAESATAARLTELMLARHVKPRNVKTVLASTCGVKYETVRKWFGPGAISIRSEHLVVVAERFNARLEWLITGSGPMDAPNPSEDDGKEVLDDLRRFVGEYSQRHGLDRIKTASSLVLIASELLPGLKAES